MTMRVPMVTATPELAARVVSACGRRLVDPRHSVAPLTRRTASDMRRPIGIS
jgi:hypothetical protein